MNPGQATATAAREILQRHFRNVLRHEPGTRDGDVESLHDMRVSIRRLRATIKLFRKHLPDEAVRLRTELGWAGRALGDVRDLDVQLGQLAEWRSALGEREAAALDEVAAQLSERRREARARMLEQLDSARYARLIDAARAELEALEASSDADPNAAIERQAPALIEKVQRKLARAGNRIDERSPAEAYHRLRIRCKALRYAIEPHRELYGKPAKRMIRALVRLQDLLGEHQDAEVGIERLHALPGAAGLAARYREHARKLRAEFPDVFAATQGRRWRALRSAMRSMADGTMETRWPDNPTRRSP